MPIRLTAQITRCRVCSYGYVSCEHDGFCGYVSDGGSVPGVWGFLHNAPKTINPSSGLNDRRASYHFCVYSSTICASVRFR